MKRDLISSLRFFYVSVRSCPWAFLWAAAWFFAIQSAQACDFCMLGQGISPYLTATGKGLTLDVNFIELDSVYDKATKIESYGKKESWLTYSLTGFYPVTEDLTVLLTLPYTVKSNLDYDAGSNSNPGALTHGIGDVTLTGRYTLFRDHSLESTWVGGLLAGLKFPTGPTGITDLQGQPVDRHALPGTGSFDYDLGFSGAYTRASGFQLTVDAVYRISGPGKWNGRDHSYGNMFNYSVKGFYRVAQTAAGSSLMPFLGLVGETTGKEKGTQTDNGYDPNLVNPSTGGTVLYWNPGLYAILSSSAILNLSFAKAFYHYMNYEPGFDADPAENYRLDFSVTYLF